MTQTITWVKKYLQRMQVEYCEQGTCKLSLIPVQKLYNLFFEYLFYIIHFIKLYKLKDNIRIVHKIVSLNVLFGTTEFCCLVLRTHQVSKLSIEKLNQYPPKKLKGTQPQLSPDSYDLNVSLHFCCLVKENHPERKKSTLN